MARATRRRKRIAIVGSGCAGIGALYALKSTEHEVHLFEAQDRLGGHTNTVPFRYDGDKEVMVDTGFIVMNSATYPNFLSFLDEIQVKTADTEMTFGVSEDQGQYEWAGTSISAIFAQSGNLYNPTHWRMIFDIIRFNHCALDLLRQEDEDISLAESGSVHEGGPNRRKRHESIGDYLLANHYGDGFRDRYLLPMTAAVWSTGQDRCALDFPAMTLVRFLWNHRLLNTITARPTWRTIPGGTKQYIDRVIEDVPRDRIHLGSPVVGMKKESDGAMRLKMENSESERFDYVVLATHGDVTACIISSDATNEEKAIFECFQTTKNEAVLHSDSSLMPIRKESWAAWNLLTESSPVDEKSVSKVSLTYDMNALQHLPRSQYGSILVTLNPPHPPDPATVQGRYSYSHPLYTSASVQAQSLLPHIQGTRNIWYAGAWTKYGFHEDGFTSGLEVGLALGGEVGWKVIDAKRIRGDKPERSLVDGIITAALQIIQLYILILSAAVGTLQNIRGTLKMKSS